MKNLTSTSKNVSFIGLGISERVTPFKEFLYQKEKRDLKQMLFYLSQKQ